MIWRRPGSSRDRGFLLRDLTRTWSRLGPHFLRSSSHLPPARVHLSSNHLCTRPFGFPTPTLFPSVSRGFFFQIHHSTQNTEGSIHSGILAGSMPYERQVQCPTNHSHRRPSHPHPPPTPRMVIPFGVWDPPTTHDITGSPGPPPFHPQSGGAGHSQQRPEGAGWCHKACFSVKTELFKHFPCQEIAFSCGGWTSAV